MRLAELPSLCGRTLANSDWIRITQAQIDAFAHCTGDHQFIHVDPVRAAAQSPFGGSIAHGFLLLSLIGGHRPRDFPEFDDLAILLNYGLERVRFVTPVTTGSRVCISSRIVDAQEKQAGRWLLRQDQQVLIEGVETPALVAQSLALLIAR